eukprot:TRINITY_DN2273_c0_g1::TRINITY_DN2273_c0_g1_i1::g.6916::m.6916 TRINITY_DN2273_c0_g1::TRINITY_DN2273_c0_g1_i1::g.6916  ORF type:complete len:405 (+),score=160.95,sp/Q8D3M4/PHNW_VIBVU/48.04/4e-115,Aminotran_5/PF00266.14/2.7e-26,Aminotran_1_2/PF00155.16/0.00042 TRINITY_DN2273_c0_g1_i1:47-1216(+)
MSPVESKKRKQPEDTNGDKLLFTPGPLTTSMSVKRAMLHDYGSRDKTFITIAREIREKLLKIADVCSEQYTTIPIQGSGTYAVEAVISSSVPRKDGKMLVFVNGAYGKRMCTICKYYDIPCVPIEFSETELVDLARAEEALKANPDVTTVGIIHSETSSGVINPVEEVGVLVHKYLPGAKYLIDAMSSFGAVPFNLTRANAHFVVSSANKCIEGVPGFSFILAEKASLAACQGNGRSLSLDIWDQYSNLEKSGQFRFTPPTHSMAAFHQALLELEAEGGVAARAKRYQNNREVLRKGMKELGFHELLGPEHTGYIITSFLYPKHENYNFEKFYNSLNDKGFAIYPGKTVNIDCFRIGSIGHLFPEDVENLVNAIKLTLEEMSIPLPLSA